MSFCVLGRPHHPNQIWSVFRKSSLSQKLKIDSIAGQSPMLPPSLKCRSPVHRRTRGSAFNAKIGWPSSFLQAVKWSSGWLRYDLLLLLTAHATISPFFLGFHHIIHTLLQFWGLTAIRFIGHQFGMNRFFINKEATNHPLLTKN